MALTPSGLISMGGTDPDRSINLELEKSATALITLNDADARELAEVPSGAISLSDFYGKSSGIDVVPCTWHPATDDFNRNSFAISTINYFDPSGRFCAGCHAVILYDEDYGGSRKFTSTDNPIVMTEHLPFPPVKSQGYFAATEVSAIIGDKKTLIVILDDGKLKAYIAEDIPNSISYSPVGSVTYDRVPRGVVPARAGVTDLYIAGCSFHDGNKQIGYVKAFRYNDTGTIVGGAEVALTQPVLGVHRSKNQREAYVACAMSSDSENYYISATRVTVADDAMSSLTAQPLAQSTHTVDVNDGFPMSRAIAGLDGDSLIVIVHLSDKNLNVNSFECSGTPTYKGRAYKEVENDRDDQRIIGLYKTTDPDCMIVRTARGSGSSNRMIYKSFRVTFSDGVPASISDYQWSEHYTRNDLNFYLNQNDPTMSDPLMVKNNTEYLPELGYYLYKSGADDQIIVSNSPKPAVL